MTTKTPSKIVHIHDKAFRSAMSDLRVARDFLSHYLPEQILNRIDLQTLALSKESYVDEELKLLVTDVLFSVASKEQTETSTFIYILCEHLSSPGRLMPWRMIRYISRIVDQHLKIDSNSYLPLVIPLVVYNGQVSYPFSTRLYDLFSEADKELAQQYMFQGFELIDFTQIPDEKMRTHQWSNVMEILLKHVFSRELMNYLESLSEQFSRLAEQQADDYLLSMLKYVIESGRYPDKERFRTFLHKSLPPPLEDKTVATLAELWLEEGFQKGIQQGEQRGIQQGIQQGEYNALIRLLEYKFHTIPEQYQQRLIQTDAQTLLLWIDRVLEARMLSDVFKD